MANPNLVSTSYIRGLGLVAARTDKGITYYHYNAHGDVVQLTDANGNTIRNYTYDAFGVEQGADETDANPFRYCGEQYDAETGNYYLRARYYTPGVGSFTQEDPVMDGLNWYGYCGGNPVVFVDPRGLQEVPLWQIVDQYGGDWGFAAKNVIYVDFGSQGRKEFNLSESAFIYLHKSSYCVDDEEFRNTFGIIDSIRGQYNIDGDTRRSLDVVATMFKRTGGGVVNNYSERITINRVEADFSYHLTGTLDDPTSLFSRKKKTIEFQKGGGKEWYVLSGDIMYDVTGGIGHVAEGWGAVANNVASLIDWSRECGITSSDIVITVSTPSTSNRYIYVNRDPGKTAEIHGVLGQAQYDLLHMIAWYYPDY